MSGEHTMSLFEQIDNLVPMTYEDMNNAMIRDDNHEFVIEDIAEALHMIKDDFLLQ